MYIVFVAGNHDYYSPLEEAARYNAYETVFGSEFTKVHPNVYFVTKDPLLKDLRLLNRSTGMKILCLNLIDIVLAMRI